VALAITKPVVNGSSGTWGTILNDALDDIVAAHNTDADALATTTTNVTALTSRVNTLEAGAGGGSPSSVYAARLRLTSSQSIGNASLNSIAFSTADYDRLGGWSAGNATRYTAQEAGDYELSGQVSFAANATGYRQVGIMLNGAHLPGGSVVTAAAPTTVTSVATRPVIVTMNAGDYVSLFGYQNSGATLGTDATTQWQPTLQVKYLGAHV
jgi:hypothetical protein